MLTQAQKYYGHDSSGEMTVIRGIMPEPPEPFIDDDDDDLVDRMNHAGTEFVWTRAE